MILSLQRVEFALLNGAERCSKGTLRLWLIVLGSLQRREDVRSRDAIGHCSKMKHTSISEGEKKEQRVQNPRKANSMAGGDVRVARGQIVLDLGRRPSAWRLRLRVVTTSNSLIHASVPLRDGFDNIMILINLMGKRC